MKQLNNEIIKAIKYFSFFSYPPNLEEIHTFLKIKASKKRITAILEKMQKQSLIAIVINPQFSTFNQSSMFKYLKFEYLDLIENWKLKIGSSGKVKQYTLVEYTKGSPKAKNSSNIAIQQFNNFSKRQQISINKLKTLRFQIYLKLISIFPQIKLVGLSGSVAMLNAEQDHDIDLFIITSKNRLWTGRFIAIILAKVLGIHRYRHSGKPKAHPESLLSNNLTIQQFNNFHKNRVCLNLFFDRTDLIIPKFKRSSYVAHEVLQMKPLIDKDNTYLMFIDANRWVFDIFPNAQNDYRGLLADHHRSSNPRKSASLPWQSLFQKVEKVLKSYQLRKIRKHRTTEIITESQLWFHPDDFEKKIKIQS